MTHFQFLRRNHISGTTEASRQILRKYTPSSISNLATFAWRRYC